MTASVPAQLLRAGLGPAVLVVLALGGASTALSGARGLLGVAVGGALAIAALAVGPALLRLSRDMEPAMVFAVAVAAYFTVVGVLAAVYLALGGAGWLSGEHAGAAVIGAAAAWLAGQVRATSRLRILAFGDRIPPGRPDAGGGGGASDRR